MLSLEKICEKLFNEFKNLDDSKGKEALSSLILSFYSTVLYKRYNGGGDYKRVLENIKNYIKS